MRIFSILFYGCFCCCLTTTVSALDQAHAVNAPSSSPSYSPSPSSSFVPEQKSAAGIDFKIHAADVVVTSPPAKEASHELLDGVSERLELLFLDQSPK